MNHTTGTINDMHSIKEQVGNHMLSCVVVFQYINRFIYILTGRRPRVSH